VSDFAVNPDIGLWEKNAVLNGRNSYYVTDEVEGTLSIKSMLSGKGSWITPEGRYVLEEGSYLVLNRGQRYSVDIRTRELSETFCVFFRPGFLEGVMDSIKAADLLEPATATGDTGFYERVNPADDLLSPALQRLRTAIRRGISSPLEADDFMIGVAAGLLKANRAACVESSHLRICSAETRREIFQRLNRSRDFLLSNLAESVDLATLASVASLSPFHYHRLFKQTFRETPHEFLTRQRIIKAKRLLAATGEGIAQVAWSVGFDGPASFSKLFKRTIGMTPSEYRLATRAN
jgi:AraC family transcriptional regulator